MPKPRRWTNQYITLVQSKPEYVGNWGATFPEGGKGKVVFDEHPPFLDYLKERFQTSDGVVCELGSGSGGHLLDRAEASPSLFFVGFELRYKRAYRTAEKGEERHLKNFFLIQGHAHAIETLCPPGTLTGVYVNFPDPWDKKKWLNNRLLSRDFLGVLFKLLKPGGFLSYKSDHTEYFNATIELIKERTDVSIEHLTDNFWESPYSTDTISSEFEQLFKSQGLPINYALMKKIGG